MQTPGGHPGYAGGCPSYPRGTAAHAAGIIMAALAVRHKIPDPLPSALAVLVTGRVVSVLYGVATVLVVFFLARRLFPDRPAVAYLTAWILALGGLHVTQSHFFLADIPSLFWTLLGLYLLARDMESPSRFPHYLHLAALSLGVASGIKLLMIAVPSLAAAALLRRPRTTRGLYAAVFFLAGFCLVNLNSFSPFDIYKAMRDSSVAALSGYHFSRLAGAGIYALELPSVLSFPIAVLAVCGALLLGRRLLAQRARARLRLVFLVVLLPSLATLWAVLFKADNFPRHLLPLFPWAAMSAAWALDRFADLLAGRGLSRAWAIVPVFVYLAVFVFDGERAFWNDPRIPAERWLLEHVPRSARVTWWGQPAVPGYTEAHYPDGAPSDAIVCDMYQANYFLSGMGWRNSYPREYKSVFGMWSQKSLDAWQSLFQGSSEYRECARFPTAYFMPEYRLTDRLIGDRSRSYVSEVVIFRRTQP